MRIVIKIGTNVLSDTSGVLNVGRLGEIAKDVFELKQNGHELVLVASGAVAVGKSQAPDVNLQYRKVLAAIGQPGLMQSFSQSFKEQGLIIGQCMLSRYDFSDRELYRGLVETLEDFFKAGVIPVINENDVSLSFGGNDSLAAMLAIAVKADLLMLLTNQPGLLSDDPRKNEKAKLISVVTQVDKEIERMCSKAASDLGQGGMISKVKAAQQAVFAGVGTFIADGREPHIVKRILLDGEILGTRFIACSGSDLNEQKRWLMANKGLGQIIVDAGAAAALNRGKSLLLPGVVAVKGLFDAGSIVEVSGGGKVVSYGKANFASKELQRALAAQQKLGSERVFIDKEVIHRDHMIILKS